MEDINESLETLQNRLQELFDQQNGDFDKFSIMAAVIFNIYGFKQEFWEIQRKGNGAEIVLFEGTKEERRLEVQP